MTDGSFPTGLPSVRMDQVEMTTTLRAWYSPSCRALQIERIGDQLECERRYTFNVLFSSPTEECKPLHFQAITRGSISGMGTVPCPDTPINNLANYTDSTYLPEDPNAVCEEYLENSANFVGVRTIVFVAPPLLSPITHLMLYYVADDGEIVADQRMLTIEECFENKVELTFPETEYEPRSQTTAQLRASPLSLCAIGAVDRRVTLLGGNNRLTREKVFQQVRSLDTGRYTFPQQVTPDFTYCENYGDQSGDTLRGRAFNNRWSPSGYVDVATTYDDSGLLVITDFPLESRPCKPTIFVDNNVCGPVFLENVADMPFIPTAPTRDSDVFSGSSPETPDIEIRQDFPDTWLWDLVYVEESGSLDIPVTLPDSITEWEAEAICVDDDTGLGISPPTSVVAFKPFFVSFTLPFSIIRGEILSLAVSVFNYLQDRLLVNLVLQETPDLELVAGNSSVQLCIDAETMMVHNYSIRSSALGRVNITVLGFSTADTQTCSGASSVSATDGMSQLLLVQPEGVTVDRPITTYFCTQNNDSSTESPSNTRLSPSFLQVLCLLRRLPYSSECDDGTYRALYDLSLPPNFVQGSCRAWVTVSGDILSPMLENLENVLNIPTGTVQEIMVNMASSLIALRYYGLLSRLTDEIQARALFNLEQGYLSLLSYRFAQGYIITFSLRAESSVLLTAQMLWIVSEASDFIFVDDNVISTSRSWLLSQQEENGCFPTLGDPLPGTLGNTDGNNSIPAPLSAYVGTALWRSGYRENASDTYDGIVRCIEANTSPTDYNLALYAYFLSVIMHPTATDYLQELDTRAVVEGDERYWANGDMVNTSVAVETAGYAILAYMELDPVGNFDKAEAVVRWLVQRKNPYGGFYSAQDTPIGLLALATFTARTNRTLGVETLTFSGGLAQTFEVNSSNYIDIQTAQVPEVPSIVYLAATGDGCALVQVTLRCNIYPPPTGRGFTLDLETTRGVDGDCSVANISVCMSYRGTGPSNLVILEIDMVTGFEPVDSSVAELQIQVDLNLQRYVYRNDQLVLYFSEVSRNETCMSFRIQEQMTISDRQPAPAKIYDYYRIENTVTTMYAVGDC